MVFTRALSCYPATADVESLDVRTVLNKVTAGKTVPLLPQFRRRADGDGLLLELLINQSYLWHMAVAAARMLMVGIGSVCITRVDELRARSGKGTPYRQHRYSRNFLSYGLCTKVDWRVSLIQ